MVAGVLAVAVGLTAWWVFAGSSLFGAQTEPPTLQVQPGDSTPDSSTSTTSTPEAAEAPGPDGRAELLVNAKSAFDDWTRSPSIEEQETMRELYDWMVVFSPYFDERLDWYENGLAYIDLYAIYTDLDKDDRSIEHPEWILTDAGGERLFIDWGCEGGTCPQWAADVGDPEFRADFLERVERLLEIGYPGVMIDDVNLLWRISNGDGETVEPIDDRTGDAMSLQDWQRYVAELVEMVRDRFPEARIMHNSIWYTDSPDFDNEFVARQIAAADWIMLERGATDGGLESGNGRYGMASFFDFIDHAHSLDTGVLYLDETAETLVQQEFNLAAYLLTTNGDDLVSTEDYPLIAHDSLWEGFSVDLGPALGERYEWEGLWRRDFERGVVLLNEPGASTRSATPEVPMKRIDGSLADQLELGAGEAAVLMHSSP